MMERIIFMLQDSFHYVMLINIIRMIITVQ